MQNSLVRISKSFISFIFIKLLLIKYYFDNKK